MKDSDIIAMTKLMVSEYVESREDLQLLLKAGWHPDLSSLKPLARLRVQSILTQAKAELDKEPATRTPQPAGVKVGGKVSAIPATVASSRVARDAHNAVAEETRLKQCALQANEK